MYDMLKILLIVYIETKIKIKHLLLHINNTQRTFKNRVGVYFI